MRFIAAFIFSLISLSFSANTPYKSTDDIPVMDFEELEPYLHLSNDTTS